MSYTFCVPKEQHAKLAEYAVCHNETPTTLFEEWLEPLTRWMKSHLSSLAKQANKQEEEKQAKNHSSHFLSGEESGEIQEQREEAQQDV